MSPNICPSPQNEHQERTLRETVDLGGNRLSMEALPWLKTCPTPVREADNGGNYACVCWGGSLWELSAPFSQLHCEPKPALKNKAFLKRRIKKKSYFNYIPSIQKVRDTANIEKT